MSYLDAVGRLSEMLAAFAWIQRGASLKVIMVTDEEIELARSVYGRARRDLEECRNELSHTDES